MNAVPVSVPLGCCCCWLLQVSGPLQELNYQFIQSLAGCSYHQVVDVEGSHVHEVTLRSQVKGVACGNFH